MALEECLTFPFSTPEGLPGAMSSFTLSDAEEAARDFELPEMVQTTFYAMLLNDAVELGIVSGFMATNLKVALEGLRCGLLLSLGCTSTARPSGGTATPADSPGVTPQTCIFCCLRSLH